MSFSRECKNNNNNNNSNNNNNNIITIVIFIIFFFAAGTSPRSQDPQSVLKLGVYPPTTIPQTSFPRNPDDLRLGRQRLQADGGSACNHASFPTGPPPPNVTDRAGKEAAGKMLCNLDAASSAQVGETVAASSSPETLAEEAKFLKSLYICDFVEEA